MKLKIYKSQKLLKSYVIYKTIERSNCKIMVKGWGLNDFDVRFDYAFFQLIRKAFLIFKSNLNLTGSMFNKKWTCLSVSVVYFFQDFEILFFHFHYLFFWTLI